jgi:Predicted transcriptional regulators
MYEIDNEKFGVFLAQLRKQKGFTQKELAQKLFLSDKAVSKWERGLSMPDIALLAPLANLLGVTITELLSGQYISEPEHMNVQEVEKLVSGTIKLSAREEKQRRQQRRRRGFLYLACVVISFFECVLLYELGYSLHELTDNILTVEALSLLFGGWLCLFVKKTLPAYYDENKIHTYGDGIFRMNMAGVNFNNSNWPHILRAGRLGLSATPVSVRA